MQQVVSGLLNKEIVAQLKITEDTIEFHRGNIMRKMRADSLAYRRSKAWVDPQIFNLDGPMR